MPSQGQILIIEILSVILIVGGAIGGYLSAAARTEAGPIPFIKSYLGLLAQ
jgi:hypothetical protein